VKYANNPVLDVGPPGAWDSRVVNHHDVNFDGTTYQMWFTGASQLNPNRIGYASSLNGIDWNKLTEPVLTPSASGWDSLNVGLPVVILDDTTYKMWHGGGKGSGGSIGYATSPDGISWTKYGGSPVMQAGPPGAWDDNTVLPCAVIFDGSTYKMWYAGNRQLPFFQIGYATSPDGITWQKHPVPVLTPGDPGEWDDHFVYTPEVIWDGDTTYHMWYLGRSTTTPGRIGYATSSDGINWVKHPNNPILTTGQSGAWDDNSVAHPRVIIIADTMRMWYAGNDGNNARIGLATDSIVVGISDKDIAAIKNFSLSQNYPNPFNPTTMINYHLPKASEVNLSVYDVSGRLVLTLVNEYKSAGTYFIKWDAQNLSSGLYFYKIEAGEFTSVKKSVLLK
jgi:predicted GH43/DUF377 family glycosyl hydrolase